MKVKFKKLPNFETFLNITTESRVEQNIIMHSSPCIVFFDKVVLYFLIKLYCKKNCIFCHQMIPSFTPIIFQAQSRY